MASFKLGVPISHPVDKIGTQFQQQCSDIYVFGVKLFNRTNGNDARPNLKRKIRISAIQTGNTNTLAQRTDRNKIPTILTLFKVQLSNGNGVNAVLYTRI